MVEYNRRFHKLLTEGVDVEYRRADDSAALDRDNLKEKLKVASGGVVFTTIQKFAPGKGEKYPKLSDRQNIVVIADEAHRS